MSTNYIDSVNVPAFEVGAYYGIAVSQAKKHLDIAHEIVKAVGADKDPSWIKFRYDIANGDVLDVLTQDLTLKHIRVIAVHGDQDDEDFVEIQVSKEAMEAYTEYCAELASVSGVIIGMLKSIMQVIAVSGIGKAANKLNEVFLEQRKD